MTSAIVYALVLSLCAGMATGVGSLIAILTRSTNRRFISFALGLSAGVMLYVSFCELFADAQSALEVMFDEQTGTTYAVLAMFGGLLLAMIIDRLVPEVQNPHELHSVEELNDANNHHKLQRMGLVTALAIAIHNFPEGIATFMATISDATVGIPIAVAVAIHNIPEGIAVAIPIYFATNSRAKAFKFSFLSGLSEPIGALAAYLILMPLMTPVMLHVIFAVVSGIMVYIAIDELLPSAEEYGMHHLSILGVIIGMAVMAVSLILL